MKKTIVSQSWPAVIATLAVSAVSCNRHIEASQSLPLRDVAPISKETNPVAEAAWLENVKKADTPYLEGKAEFAKGHYATAEGLFQQAIQIEPTHAQARLSLARALEQQGKAPEALKAYEELVLPSGRNWGSSIGSDITTRMRFVLAALRQDKWDEAVKVYDLMIKDSIFTNGKPILAEKFDSARRDVPRLKAVAHLLIGICGPTFGPTPKDEMNAHLEEAARLQPNMPVVQYHYAQMLAKEKRYDEAQKAYEKTASTGSRDIKAKSEEMLARIRHWRETKPLREGKLPPNTIIIKSP